MKNLRMAGYSGNEVEEDAVSGEARVSEALRVEEQESAGMEDALPPPTDALPETSQGAVVDAVGNMDGPLR
jgi:hypothetical protein